MVRFQVLCRSLRCLVGPTFSYSNFSEPKPNKFTWHVRSHVAQSQGRGRHLL